MTVSAQKNLMVIGVDVYHDSVHGQKRSITGFVASTNRYQLPLSFKCLVTHFNGFDYNGVSVCV